MSKSIAFFGADSGVGTTMTAASIAAALKARKNKVLLLLTSSEIDENWFMPSASSDLGVLLRRTKLDKNDLANAITKTDSFDFIRGSRDPLKKQFYDIKMMPSIMSLLSNDYDYIIIDAGSDVSLPLSCSALMYSDRRFYVFDGGAKSTGRFLISKEMVIDGLGLDMTNDKLILNKESRRVGGRYDLDTTRSKIGMDGFSLPAYDNSYAYEMEGEIPYPKAGSSYAKSINLIADEIETIG